MDLINQAYSEPKVCLMKNWRNQCSSTSSLFPILYEPRSRKLVEENKKKNESTLFLYKVMISQNYEYNWIQKLSASLNPIYGDLSKQWDAGEIIQNLLDKLDPNGKMFHLSSRTSLKCSGAGCNKLYQSAKTITSVLHLRLKLDEAHRSMAEILDRHLTGSELMPCDKCFPQTEEEKLQQMPRKEMLMSKEVFIDSCPMFLLVCVDRNHDSGQKIKTKVTYAQTLWLPIQNGHDQLYRLYAVVEHQGERTTEGHYITHMCSNDLQHPKVYNDRGGSSDATFEIEPIKKFEKAKHNGYLFYYKKAEEMDLEGFLKKYDYNNEGICTSSDDEQSLTDTQKIKRMQKLLTSSEAKRRKIREVLEDR